MPSLAKITKAIKMKLVRYDEYHAPAINMDDMTLGTLWFPHPTLAKWFEREKTHRFSEQGPAYQKYHSHLLNKQAVNRLASHNDYDIVIVDGKRILFNKYMKVKTKIRHGRRSSLYSQQGIVQKQNSRKKRARAESKAREIQRKKYRRGWPWYETPADADPYGINDVSNTAFGHPRRKFNVNDKGEANAERRYKERNIPTYPES